MSQFLTQPRALLPNTPNATPRQVGDLHLWTSGDALQAADLNANFLLLLGMVGSVAARANLADPAIEEIIHEVIELGDKIEHVEEHLGREAKRAQQTSIPLAALASLKKQLDGLEGPLRRHADALQALLLRQRATQDDLGARLQRLEQKPAAATQTELQGLQQSLARLAGEAQAMRYDLMTAQREIQRLEPMAQAEQESRAQRVLRSDYAMGQIEQLRRRADALERPHEEVREAQAEVAAMRNELQARRQEMQQVAEKQREDNLRLHAALLERIETLEKQYGPEAGRPG